MPNGPLSDVSVDYLAGNHATWLMGMLWAAVIKIKTKAGDALRQMGPVIAGPVGACRGGELRVMANKRSIGIDLSMPQGQQSLDRLVEKADVVFSNQEPSSLRKLNITYERLRQIKPAIVFSTASSSGNEDVCPTGPFGSLPAFCGKQRSAPG